MGKRIESTRIGCVRERSLAALGARLAGVVFFSFGIGARKSNAVFAAGMTGGSPTRRY